MKSFLRSVRIAPKKAEILAKMIRGKSVPDAVYLLEHVNKKAARILQSLLRSAMANASHNDKQDPQMLIVKTIVVNKAQVFHRGVPMARGRVRPIKKFQSHIDLALGFADELEKKKKTQKNQTTEKSDSSSQSTKKTVQKTTTAKSTTSSKSKSVKDSASPTSPSLKSSKS